MSPSACRATCLLPAASSENFGFSRGWRDFPVGIDAPLSMSSARSFGAPFEAEACRRKDGGAEAGASPFTSSARSRSQQAHDWNDPRASPWVSSRGGEVEAREAAERRLARLSSRSSLGGGSEDKLPADSSPSLREDGHEYEWRAARRLETGLAGGPAGLAARVRSRGLHEPLSSPEALEGRDHEGGSSAMARPVAASERDTRRNLLKEGNVAHFMLQEICDLAKDCKRDLDDLVAPSDTQGRPASPPLQHQISSGFHVRTTRRRGTTSLTTSSVSPLNSASDFSLDFPSTGGTEKQIKQLLAFLTQELLPTVDRAKAEADTLRRSNANLAEKLKRSEKLNQHQTEQMDDLQEEWRRTESQSRHHLTEAMEKLRAENFHLKAQLDLSEKHLEDERKEKSTLEQKLVFLERKTKERTDTQGSARAAEILGELDSARREVKRLTTLTSQKDSMIEDLKEALRATREENSTMSARSLPRSSCGSMAFDLPIEGGEGLSRPSPLAADLAQQVRLRIVRRVPALGGGAALSERLGRRRELDRARRNSIDFARKPGLHQASLARELLEEQSRAQAERAGGEGPEDARSRARPDDCASEEDASSTQPAKREGWKSALTRAGESAGGGESAAKRSLGRSPREAQAGTERRTEVLQHELEELRKNHAQILDRNEVLKKYNDTLEKHFQAELLHYVKKEDLERAERACEKAREREETLAQRYEAAQMEREDTRSRREDVAAKLAATKHEKETLERERDKEIETLREDQKRLERQREAERNQAEARREELMSRINALQREKDALEAEKEDAARFAEEDACKRREESRQREAALEEEKASLRQRLEGSERKQEDLEKQLTNVKGLLRSSEAEAASLRAAADNKTGQLASRLAELEGRLGTVEAHRERLARLLEETKREKDDLENRLSRLQSSATEEKTTLKGDLEKAEQKKRELERDRRERDEELAARDADLASLRKTLERLTASFEAEREEVKRLQDAKDAELQEWRGRYESVAAQLEKLRGENALQQEVFSHVGTQLASVKAKQETLDEEAASIRAQLEQAREEKAELLQTVAALQASRDSQQATVDEAKKSLESVAKLAVDLEANRNEIQTRLAAASKETSVLKRTCAMLKEEVFTTRQKREKDLEAFKALLKKKNDERKKQVRQMLEVNENLGLRKEETEQRLVEQLQDARNDISALVSRLFRPPYGRRGSQLSLPAPPQHLSTFAAATWQTYEAKADSMSSLPEGSPSLKSARKTHRPVDMYRPVALSIQNLVHHPSREKRPIWGLSSDSVGEDESDLLDFFPDLVSKIRSKLFRDRDAPPPGSYRQRPPLPPADSCSSDSEGEEPVTSRDSSPGRRRLSSVSSSSSSSSHEERSAFLTPSDVHKHRHLRSIKVGTRSGQTSPLLAMWEPSIDNTADGDSARADALKQHSSGRAEPDFISPEPTPADGGPAIRVTPGGDAETRASRLRGRVWGAAEDAREEGQELQEGAGWRRDSAEERRSEDQRREHTEDEKDENHDAHGETEGSSETYARRLASRLFTTRRSKRPVGLMNYIDVESRTFHTPRRK
ncbi:hypothetical protein BESB_074320 [Besnoitia besnoiti]|uniref:Uncharacterized protein n=1 Tax=Besnoitia besnoiti TaxID=94643 RepID=A0A2A9MFX3_BESBE|nr:uncharacterized protein BESB_074320 [Besnoitia besnoiti]PFH34280.1 hypothetical protein BESB_074320 [Besnoitia besnoiti]